MEPSPLHWEHGVLTTGPLGKSLILFLAMLLSLRDLISPTRDEPGPSAARGVWSPNHWTTREFPNMHYCNYLLADFLASILAPSIDYQHSSQKGYLKYVS